jgi:hypothetical protein
VFPKVIKDAEKCRETFNGSLTGMRGAETYLLMNSGLRASFNKLANKIEAISASPAKEVQESPMGTNIRTWFAGAALIAAIFLAIALPGTFPADAAHTGVTLIGP